MGQFLAGVTMARICVLLCLVLLSAISFSGVVAKDITEVKLGDADNSISHLTNSEEIILRERRFSDAEKKQDRKRADGRSKKRQKGKKEQKRRKNKKGKNKR